LSTTLLCSLQQNSKRKVEEKQVEPIFLFLEFCSQTKLCGEKRKAADAAGLILRSIKLYPVIPCAQLNSLTRKRKNKEGIVANLASFVKSVARK